MAHPVVHFEICLKDGRKGAKFYQDLFGWKMKLDEKFGYNMVEKEEGGIPGGIFQTDGKFPPYATIYVQVDSVGGALDKAVHLGGKVCVEPQAIGDMGFIAMFNDPEGNLIGLWGMGK